MRLAYLSTRGWLCAAFVIALLVLALAPTPSYAMWKQQAQTRFATCAKGYAAFKAANHTTGKAAYRAYMAGCAKGPIKPAAVCKCTSSKKAARRR